MATDQWWPRIQWLATGQMTDSTGTAASSLTRVTVTVTPVTARSSGDRRGGFSLPSAPSLPAPLPYLRSLTESRADPGTDCCFASPWQSGFTGLIQAAQNGHEAVVRLLIEHKAKVDAKSQVSPLRFSQSLPLSLLSPASPSCLTLSSLALALPRLLPVPVPIS